MSDLAQKIKKMVNDGFSIRFEGENYGTCTLIVSKWGKYYAQVFKDTEISDEILIEILELGRNKIEWL